MNSACGEKTLFLGCTTDSLELEKQLMLVYFPSDLQISISVYPQFYFHLHRHLNVLLCLHCGENVLTGLLIAIRDE